MIQELLYVTDYRNLPINMDRCSFKRPCIDVFVAVALEVVNVIY